jgi:carbon storage regulator
MLILTRRPDERIVIGKDIEVTILEVHGDQVKLGVSAPREVKVFRREVFDAIQAENRAAAESAMDIPSLGLPTREPSGR